MGGSLYSMSSRKERATTLGYHTRSVSDTFVQTKIGKIHESMEPKGVKIRECRDSETHPNTVPVICTLDLTGSMGDIPAHLVKDGLPTLMSTMIQRGIPDASLLFLGVGDHEFDTSPLQIGQFESGDAELDMWLTRTWLEKGGGSNAGESYLLAWYFAAFHTSIDAFEKRGKKGFLFTIGDEPNLHNLPASAVKGIMGDASVAQGNYTEKQLLEAAQRMYHVFHIHVNHGRSCDPGWKKLLGQNCIETNDYTQVPHIIAQTVLDHTDTTATVYSSQAANTEIPITTTTSKEDILL